MKKIVSKLILYVMGWKVVSDIPTQKKYVIIVSPHTSNWDFIIGRCFGYMLEIEAKYLGKSQLFRFPYGWIFRLLGGIPVDRSKHNNLVAYAVDLFKSSNELVLGLAPEGSRSRVEKWKLGFYHIAVGANIPIALAYLDYAKKEAGIGEMFLPSGEIQKDLQKIEDFYKGISPKYSEKYNSKIF
ncbi:MAG: lysophospholipid acyltransferase family protein [Flavobacteriales bacterium]